MLWRIFLVFVLVMSAVAAGSPDVQRVSMLAGLVDWPSYNHDLTSQRYAGLNQITRSNVGRLHVICTAQLGGPNNFQSGPIVVGGVLFVTRSNQTIAMSASTCRTLWSNTYRTSIASQTRGVAYADGMVFRGFANGHVIAINATTGLMLWDTTVVAAGSYEYIDAAPVVWNGMLFIGTADGDAAQICHMLALNEKSGRVLWSEQTVPDPGSVVAVQTWQRAINISGGSMWTSFSIDPATGRLYVPVGNPQPDYDIRKRLGSNLFTNSILELNATNGALHRGIQLVPEDDHDWDQSTPPAIVTLRNGAKIALAAGKDGYLRAISLKTLTVAWKTPLTTILNATAPIVSTGTHYCPSGAVYWNGPAYSPATGFAYVNAVDWCETVHLSASPQPYIHGHLWTGTSDHFGTRDTERSGWLSAVNATTGTVAWRYHSTLPLVAAVTPTSGGVLFTADLLGNILAFNAATGAVLASVGTALPVGGGIITYEASGRQYVAVAAGMTGNFATPQANTAIVVLGI